mgnify:CR=1 FL=1
MKQLYKDLADINGFDRIPDPYFAPIATTDITALIQFAVDALNSGSISKDTVSQLYGSDFETEANQIETEIAMDIPTPEDIKLEKSQEFEMKNKKDDRAFQEKQGELAHERNLETIKAAPKPASK